MKRETLSGKPAVNSENRGAPAPKDPVSGQHTDHWVLSELEIKKGFMRPVRHSYVHDKCGVETKMPNRIAETYARDPKFYGSTFCCANKCKEYFPVSEFKWDNGETVGS